MSETALELSGIVRTFHQGGQALHVLRKLNLTLQRGELVALVGPSGAGKSTLLYIAGLLEKPDAGKIVIGGETCNLLSDDARTGLRRRYLGFVYQFHHLLPEFSALENVVLPQMIAGTGRRAARQHARELLGALGLAQRESHRPARLSGGEQQRVAIARALANRPAVLLADEPTGNLDHDTALGVMAELKIQVRERSLAALVATHNLELAASMDRIVSLQDGVLVAG